MPVESRQLTASAALVLALGSVLLAPTSAAPLSSSPKASPTAVARQIIQALYNAQDAALGRHDVRGAVACYGPSYVAVGQDGTRHVRDEEFDALEKVCAMGQNLRQHSQIVRLIARGRQASLVLRRTTTMDVFNPNTHQSLALTTDVVSQDLWTEGPQGWQVTFSKAVWQKSSTGAPKAPPAPAKALHPAAPKVASLR